LLARIGRVDERTINEEVRLHASYALRADELGLARTQRAREESSRRLAQNRDIAAWQATMAQLDAEEAHARLPAAGRSLTAAEIVDYLWSLPSLWADSGPGARQALATSIFARLEVLGLERLEYELADDAVALGLEAALPAVLELDAQVGEFGRGERSRTTARHLNVPASLPLEIEVTGAERWLRSLNA